MSRPRSPLDLNERDRRIVSLAIPALGTLAIEPVYVLVDTAIVGRIGTDELAGLGIAATVLLTLVAFAGFLEYELTPRIAHALGREDPHGAKKHATQGLWLTLLMGVPVAALVAVAARPVSRLLGGEGGVLDAAATYLQISAIGLPFVLVAFVGHGVMRGYNDLRKPLVIVAVANVANLVLELLFVWGFGWGMAGSAGSTVIVQIAAAGWFVHVLRPVTLRSRPHRATLLKILRAGSHLGLRSMAMLTVWIVATSIAARTDTPTLAAHQILIQLFTFLALALDAFAIPAQSLVAGALGAGDRDEAAGVGWAGARLAAWCGVALGVILAVASPVIPMAFTPDADVRSRVTGGLLILAVMQLPGAIAFALDGALLGAQDERFLGRAAVVNLISFAPFAVATLLAPRLGITGLWLAQLTWMVMRAVVNTARWRSSHWPVAHA